MENKFTNTQNKMSNIEKDSIALEIKQLGLRDLMHNVVRTADNIYVSINGAYTFFSITPNENIQNIRPHDEDLISTFDDFSSEVCGLENILDEALCRAYKLFDYLDANSETDTIAPEQLYVLVRPKMTHCIGMANELLTVVEGIYNIIFPSKPSEEKDYKITLDCAMPMVSIIEQIQCVLDDIVRVMHDINGGL